MKSPARQSQTPTSIFLLELLEPRIAPAGFAVGYTDVTLETPQLLQAGQGLISGGKFLLAVEQGSALVFTTDLNGNGSFDANEITGLSLSDGSRITLFVDINGDVVTNLQKDGRLTDSGLPDPRRDADPLYRDGRILLNSNIQSITLRSVTEFDLLPGDRTLESRVALSSYSIHGNIYAGSVGVGGEGIVIDTSGLDIQVREFTKSSNSFQQKEILPNIGGIRTGTAVNGHSFSFGFVTNPSGGGTPGAITVGGEFIEFVPVVGQSGGDIIGLRSGQFGLNGVLEEPARFTIDAIIAGDGGVGARGGNIQNVSLFGDSGGLRIVAGDGGAGPTGGNGGSILNLSDFGSTNGMVEIRAGNGGKGFVGNGGLAGTLTLGQFDMNGQIFMGLGSGGDALVNAGVGTGLVQANMNPTAANGTYSPIKVLSTYHVPGQIGSVTPIDFNGDGFTDLVYLTDTPDQLMIRFGGPGGITGNSPILYFATPGLSPVAGEGVRTTGVTVGDFNDDGFLDIAIAPSVTNSFGPLRVFLNPGGTDAFGFGTGNGWSQAASLPDGGNYIDSYVMSPLPFLNMLPGTVIQRGGMPVTNMVSGLLDNDPNGIVDLALTSQVFTRVAIIPGEGEPTREFTTLTMMSGTGDGRFFADFSYNRDVDLPGKKPIADNGGVAGLLNDAVLFNHGRTQLLVSALDTTSPGQPEALVVAALGDGDQKSIHVVQWGLTAIVGAPGPVPGLATLAVAEPEFFGIKIKDGDFDGYDGPKFGTPLALTIADTDLDGRLEIVVLNDGNSISLLHTPGGGLFGFNSGVELKGEQVSVPALGFDQPVFPGDAEVNFLNVLAGQFTPASAGNPVGEVAIYSFGPGATARQFFPLTLTPYFDQGGDRLGVQLAGPAVDAPGSRLLLDDDIDESIIIQDVYKARTTAALDAFVGAIPTLNLASMGILSTDRVVGFYPVSKNIISLVGGNGGNSLLGVGGRGGTLGSGFSGATTSAFSVILPADRNLQPDTEFVAGGGGFGLTGGGAGGGVRGVFVAYEAGEAGAPLANEGTYRAGAGGGAVLGAGGAGGDVVGNKIFTGFRFEGGNGGAGLTGGRGGDVVGAGGGLLGFDNYSAFVRVIGGAGGDGVTAAGQGGSIISFANLFPRLVTGEGGALRYFAGDGGSAVAGQAGQGGSIRNASPIGEDNRLQGLIDVRAGAGGDGLMGGQGGGILNFQNRATIEVPPDVFSILAGNGGTSVTGRGGEGGSLVNVDVQAKGVYTPLPGIIAANFNRLAAGHGGDSYGAAGGAGGSLRQVTAASSGTESSIVALAGHGGDGLSIGGAGGGLNNVSLDASRKVIAFAGDGGDAYGALATAVNVKLTANELDAVTALRAFGGVNGRGGNGGGISVFNQPAAIEAGLGVAVDLATGQGGSIMNYGSAVPGAATSVGAGGSMTNVTLKGEAGRGGQNSPIEAYRADFADVVRTAAGWLNQLADSTDEANGRIGGNIGVVIGAAGQVRAGAFAGDSAVKAGAVQGFTAKSIMSMVAGSVDSVAAIRSISGLTLTSTSGVFGDAKTPNANEAVYERPDGTLRINNLQLGDKLIDGAVVAGSFTPVSLINEPRVWLR